MPVPIIDEVFVTGDEEYDVESSIGDAIECLLKRAKLDTYNGQWVVHVVVRPLSDHRSAAFSDDDDEEGDAEIGRGIPDEGDGDEER